MNAVVAVVVAVAAALLIHREMERARRGPDAPAWPAAALDVATWLVVVAAFAGIGVSIALAAA